MTPTPIRTVVALHDDAPDGALDAAARALDIALLAPVLPARRSGPALATWPFAVEAQADALDRERFAVLACGEASALGLAVAYVLPHRTEALGLVAPGPVPPPDAVDAAGLTVPTLVWPGGHAPAWVATVPGARLEPAPIAVTQVLRRLLAVGD